MEGLRTVRKKCRSGEFVEVGRAGENAGSFFAPPLRVAAIGQLRFYGRKSLQQELAIVEKGECVLAGDASGDLVDQDFAESDVDGGSRLEIAYGGENVGGDDVAIGDAAHFSIEMVMAQVGVSWIDGVGATFTVGAEELATAVGRQRRSGRRGSLCMWSGVM
jgi:hypothetical protein